MIFNLTILILGLVASLYLFWRLPYLNLPALKEQSAQTEASLPDEPAGGLLVSIIIPARNEAETLPLLLADLKLQTLQPHEIICVNDGSEDETSRVITHAGAILVDVHDKPENWMGKAWACLKGAERATGQLLLFLDADVRMAPDGLAKLLLAYGTESATVSVQPYHKIHRAYEQFSMFFNIVLIGANGTGLPKKNCNVGLYGPVILIPKADYDKIGGHRAVQRTIVDDLAMGDVLTHAGLKYRLYLGDGDISFRMYPDGFKSMLQGWTKNFATGAEKTPGRLRILMFGWVTSCTAPLLYLMQSLWAGEIGWAFVYLLFYGIWVVELNRIVPKIGNFQRAALLVYPIFLLVFLATFFWSLWKKIFRRQVTWKGRKMKPEA